MSRRAFLQALAAAGLAATGIASGATGAIRQAGPQTRRTADQLQPDPIADLAAELLYDVDGIYAFVRDFIRYEPYVGILRGAEGTLAARAGNSADQSLLLAALLDVSLTPHRFVTGRLDAQAADGIVAAAVTDAESFERASLDALAGVLPGATPPTPPELDPETQAEVDRAAEATDQVLTWAHGQVETTLSSIETALRSIGADLPRDFSAIPIRETDQHVWVQAAQGPEWLDLDPSMPTNAPGRALAAVTEVLETLPDELYHGVEFVVIGEFFSGDTYATETLLRLSTQADRLAGLPVTFLNASPDGVQQLAEAVTPIDGVTSYVPTIVIGDEGFGGSQIRFGRAGALESDLLDGGSLFEGSGAFGESTAEWLEVGITSPDSEPVVVRRAVFDRLGPAARASGPTSVDEIAPAMQVTLADDSTEILPALASTWLAVNVGLPDRFAPILRQTDDDTGAGAVFAYGQHVFRELGDDVLGLPLGSRSFIDAPNLVAFTVRPKSGTDGVERVESAIDIWHRSHGTIPVADVVVQASPAALAGVLDHVVERFISGDIFGSSAEQDRGKPVSVGAIFDAARRDGVKLRGVRTQGDVDDLPYPAAARAMLGAALADGWLAVAPERPVLFGEEERVGWWLIDPVSGRAIDQLDDGRGGINEYGVTLTPGQLAREHALKKLARDCLAGTAFAAAALITAAMGGRCVLDPSIGAGFPRARAACAFVNGFGTALSGAEAYQPLKFCVKAALA